MIGKSVAHYKILEKIGEGGMGVVYKAEDTKLRRTVALKFLPAELTRDAQAKARFVQEAQAAAALDHPNICAVFEIGEAEGSTYIAMPYVKGQSLKERIAMGPLSMGEALDIAGQVAEGLKEAHERGIVHRDIKPANIMLTEKGQAKIMDFGLAKLESGVDLTRTMAVMGTAAYMSPEQARGEEVDHRTDIWSFGATLYEMLTGQKPFGQKHDQALIYSILNDTTETIIKKRPEIPSYLDQVIQKALEKDKSRRYQSMTKLLKDLKATKIPVQSPPKTEKSIIVLPFENISPDPDQEYFCDGMTEEIITDLSHIHDLLVISRSSAMTFKGTKKTIPEIAQAVNVRYILEGSVRKAGNNLRITAQLIDAVNDTHVWAEKYSGTLDDVFDIQERVSSDIVKALKLVLTSEEAGRMAERPIGNVAAYECYLKAKHDVWSFTKEGTERALQYLQNALGILGENTNLYAGLGLAYFQLVNLGVKQEEYLEKAREYAQKTFALDPGSPQGHAIRGYVCMLEGDMRRAISHMKKAISSDPVDAETVGWLGYFYLLVGKASAAVPLVERSLKMDPVNPNWHLARGLIDFFEGHFDFAAEQLREAYIMAPHMPMNQFWYALSLAYAKRFQESLSILDIDKGAAPLDDAFKIISEFLRAVLRGEKDTFSRLQTPDVLRTIKRDLQLSYHAASFCSFLGQPNDALDWLENAVNRGFYNCSFMEVDPFLANIRNEPRFKKLMERVKYEWEHFEV